MKKLIPLLAVALTVASSAFAASTVYDLTWSGASFSNSATATGELTVDLSLLPNPGSVPNTDFASLGISDFSITITGASSGNGTFVLSDFDTVAWWTGDEILDLSSELVGQSTAGNAWGTPDGNSGDFNVFAANPSAPDGTYYFTLTTSDDAGDNMLLTSFAPAAVPEPAATAGIIGGLALLCVGARRFGKKRA